MTCASGYASNEALNKWTNESESFSCFIGQQRHSKSIESCRTNDQNEQGSLKDKYHQLTVKLYNI